MKAEDYFGQTPQYQAPKPQDSQGQPQQDDVPTVDYRPKISSGIVIFIVVAIIMFVCGIIAFVFIMLTQLINDSDRLSCESSSGNITIAYDGNQLKGYSASMMSFNLDDERRVVRRMGIEAYLQNYKENFEARYDGVCEFIEK